ncbi:MAG: YlmC/YmxH family sporulation protein [Bacilli bacterium]|nr:YlmC/YmxH family sporulation protein [Bacilli bacterium]
MNELTFCELREKEIVNVADGKRLGRVTDLALTCNGRVLGVMAPGDKSTIKAFGGKERVFIPWQNITKIGDDVILVNLMVGAFPVGS